MLLNSFIASSIYYPFLNPPRDVLEAKSLLPFWATDIGIKNKNDPTKSEQLSSMKEQFNAKLDATERDLMITFPF